MGKDIKATEEQIAYGKLLDVGMKAGLLMLVVTFVIYLLGIMPVHVPVNDLPKVWGLSVHKYLEVTGAPIGWGWLAMLGKADFLNFIGIAFLSGVTILCYLRIIPILFSKKDTIYGVLAIVEVLVLVLAASGILKSGGH
ncbi:MAG: hypothetical protein EPN22_12600 [Nitrospirae bacterium]|nr:MAG: hypothetical protein EPN22_12600 [Nitrospirota bacterium]